MSLVLSARDISSPSSCSPGRGFFRVANAVILPRPTLAAWVNPCHVPRFVSTRTFKSVFVLSSAALLVDYNPLLFAPARCRSAHSCLTAEVGVPETRHRDLRSLGARWPCSLPPPPLDRGRARRSGRMEMASGDATPLGQNLDIGGASGLSSHRARPTPSEVSSNSGARERRGK